MGCSYGLLFDIRNQIEVEATNTALGKTFHGIHKWLTSYTGSDTCTCTCTCTLVLIHVHVIVHLPLHVYMYMCTGLCAVQG